MKDIKKDTLNSVEAAAVNLFSLNNHYVGIESGGSVAPRKILGVESHRKDYDAIVDVTFCEQDGNEAEVEKKMTYIFSNDEIRVAQRVDSADANVLFDVMPGLAMETEEEAIKDA